MWNDVKNKEAIYQCYACRVLLLPVKKSLLINRADALHIDQDRLNPKFMLCKTEPQIDATMIELIGVVIKKASVLFVPRSGGWWIVATIH